MNLILFAALDIQGNSSIAKIIFSHKKKRHPRNHDLGLSATFFVRLTVHEV